MIRRVSLLAWAPVASATLIIVAIYSSWAVAYAQLGRRPVPSMDDPKAIGGLATSLYWFCLVLAAIWAITSLIAMLMGVLPKTKQRSRWWLGFLAGLTAFSLVFLWTSFSSDDVMEWLRD